MTKLISIFDVEITQGKKINRKSPIVLEAMKRMKNKNQFHEEEYEDVLDMTQFLLTCHEVANDVDNKRENINGQINKI